MFEKQKKRDMETGEHNKSFKEDYNLLYKKNFYRFVKFTKKYENYFFKNNDLNIVVQNTEIYFKWFYDNYIEEYSEICHIIKIACSMHCCSVESLYEACKEISSYRSKKTSLRNDVKYFVKLADHGISGNRAGEMLNSFFVCGKILSTYPHEKP